MTYRMKGGGRAPRQKCTRRSPARRSFAAGWSSKLGFIRGFDAGRRGEVDILPLPVHVEDHHQ